MPGSTAMPGASASTASTGDDRRVSAALSERLRRSADGRLHYSPAAGDVVVLRHAHVCGGEEAVITVLGVDVRLVCRGCGAKLVIPRDRFLRRVRDVVGTVLDDPA